MVTRTLYKKPSLYHTFISAIESVNLNFNERKHCRERKYKIREMKNEKKSTDQASNRSS